MRQLVNGTNREEILFALMIQAANTISVLTVH